MSRSTFCRQVAELSRPARDRPFAWKRRYRAYALGDARQAVRGERAPPQRWSDRIDSQRHYREFSRAAGGAAGVGPTVFIGDRYRDHRAPDRQPSGQRHGFRRCDTCRHQPTRRVVCDRCHEQRRAGQAGCREERDTDRDRLGPRRDLHRLRCSRPIGLHPRRVVHGRRRDRRDRPRGRTTFAVRCYPGRT